MQVLGNHVWLYNLFVKEKFRNQKIGKKLLKETIKIAKKQKFSTIKLQVRKKNKIALKLYKKIGFIEYDSSNSDLYLVLPL